MPGIGDTEVRQAQETTKFGGKLEANRPIVHPDETLAHKIHGETLGCGMTIP